MSEMLPRRQRGDATEQQIIDVATPQEPPSIDLRQDNLREKIALLLTYAIISITVMPIVAVIAFPASSGAIKEITALIIPATIGIYGTIIGFYFGRGR